MALKFRRGTTAQKSGSLAFGEPFINTDLNTLQIGGASGDITLGTTGESSAFAGVSVSASSFISGSGLKITGNAAIDGNLTLGGAITIGDATADTVNVVASLSSSLIPSNDNAFDVGSSSKRYKKLYTKEVETSHITLTSGSAVSINLTNTTANTDYNIRNTVGGNFAILNTLGNKTIISSVSASVEDREYVSIGGDLFISGNIESNPNSEFTASIFSGSIAGIGNVSSYSSSVNSRLVVVEGVSASAASALNSLSSSAAKVGSTNIFSADQTITGSLYISANLVVQGSSSIQTISSSTLNIGTNLITVNTLNPGTRFGGLAVIDSGSSPLISGSILFDSINDQWIFVHQIVSGAATTSSVFLMGPQTYNSLGSEAYPTTNKVVKSINSEHIGDSNITDTGTLITLGSNTSVTGTLVATGTSLVSASAQITLSSTTGYSTFSTSVDSRLDSVELVSASAAGALNSVSGAFATRIGNLAGTYATDASVTSVSGAFATTVSNLGSTYATDAELSAVSSAVATRTAGIDTTINTLSSSVNTRLVTLEGKDISVTLTGDVTGTGTITDLGNVSFATTIAANSVALGTDTTGDYVSSLVAGTNITLSNNSGEGATPTIGLTNNTISGIALGSNLATLTIGTGLSGTSYNGSGAVTIANTGVTSNVAGTGVTVSGATGAVTISIGQAVATSDNVRFNSLGIGMAASATAGRIDATNDIVAFSSSDIRFKENIKPIENAIDKIRKISGNTYDWKEENKIEHGYEGNDVGVIAQEIEAVLPQLVQTRESGYKAVKYDKLVALLIEGIKEQQLQIEQLRIDLDNCRNKGL